jgi:hypothetical protein
VISATTADTLAGSQGKSKTPGVSFRGSCPFGYALVSRFIVRLNHARIRSSVWWFDPEKFKTFTN